MVSKDFKILQWNWSQLHWSTVTTFTNVHIACVKETRLSPNSKFWVKHYSTYNLNPNPQNESAATPGGITILVHSSVPHTNLKLNSNLQFEAVRNLELLYTTQLQFVTFITLYLSSCYSHWKGNRRSYSPTSNPIYFYGDFNAHHSLWGSRPWNLG